MLFLVEISDFLSVGIEDMKKSMMGTVLMLMMRATQLSFLLGKCVTQLFKIYDLVLKL